MEKIDLTKCNNCRAWVRYRYDRVYEDTGRIEKVTEGGGEAWMRFVADEDGELITMWEDGKICEHIMDFEIVPRDPETYRDWQVGDKVNISDTHICWEELVEVIFRSGELVVCKDSDNNATETKTCDQLYREGGRLVLTCIESQIIEEKKYEPQDGDIVAWKEKKDDGDSAITIYRGNHRGYFTMFINGKSMGDNKYDSTLDMNIIRPATEDEKQKLFEAMAKQGKRWNAEKKVVEDIPKPHEFRKGEPVLVRTRLDDIWQIAAFAGKSDRLGFFADKGGHKGYYDFCIPYNERTMHLLGTSEDYKEEQL